MINIKDKSIHTSYTSMSTGQPLSEAEVERLETLMEEASRIKVYLFHENKLLNNTTIQPDTILDNGIMVLARNEKDARKALTV